MDGLTVIVDDIVGSTGLELKVDPGVPYVYAGFAGQPPQHVALALFCQLFCYTRLPNIDYDQVSHTVHMCSERVKMVLSFSHAGLMITTLVSYLSHSQVWALQEGSLVHVGGRSNRATVTFALELNDLMNSIPELPPPVSAERAAADLEA